MRRPLLTNSLPLAARKATAVVLALLVALGVVGSAESASAQDVGGQRARVASLAKQLDRLQLQSSMLDERYLAAQDDVAALERKKSQNRAEVSSARARLAKMKSQAGSYVVSAYIGAGADSRVAMGSGSPNESVNQKVMLDVLRGDRVQMADDLSARELDLADSRRQLDAVDEKLKAKKSSLEQLRKNLVKSVNQQEKLLAGANAQLRSAIAAEQQRMAAAAEQAAAARAAATRRAAAGRTGSAGRRSTTGRAASEPRGRAATAPGRATGAAGRPASGMAESAAATPAPVASAPLPVAAPSSGVGAVLSAGRSVFGTRYRWGGTSVATGFDCSGFTSYAWRAAGVNLPRSSRAQYAGTQRVSLSQLQPGDLVFYGRPIHHVAIYIGGGQVMHSPHTGDVVRTGPLRNPIGAGRPG